MYAVGIETGSVAVIGISSLKTEVKYYLDLGVSRDIRHIKSLGIRSLAEINDIGAAADSTQSYDVAVLEIEFVDAAYSRVALQVIGSNFLGIETEVPYIVQRLVEIADRSLLV